jgi:hypothetical protein
MNNQEPTIIIKNILDNSFNKWNWKQLFSIINISKDNSLLIKYINNLLITQQNNELILDIIDFIVNYGNNEIIKLISSNEFLISLINILQIENNSNIEIQKKVIYLIQKWAFNFQNSNFNSFNECYIYLKNNGIIFPPIEEKIETYCKYINDNELKNLDITQNNINDPFNIDGLNPIIENINFDKEKTLSKIHSVFNLVNEASSKISDKSKILLVKEKWYEKIIYYNKIIDNVKNKNISIELQNGMIEFLRALDTIIPLINKYSEEIEIEDILIKIRNDIEMTIFRYNQLENNQIPVPFFSAFDGNNRRYGEIYYYNYNLNKPEIDNKNGKNKFLLALKSSLSNVGNRINQFVNHTIKGDKKDNKNSNNIQIHNNNLNHSYNVSNNNYKK